MSLYLLPPRPRLLPLVQLMLEAATRFQGGPVTFHLFVVAASSPIQGTWGVSLTMPSQIGQSEWRVLGQRIAQVPWRDTLCPLSFIIPSSSEYTAT